jgi:hypothetical protein
LGDLENAFMQKTGCSSLPKRLDTVKIGSVNASAMTGVTRAIAEA